ncbi:MAG: HAD family hydrolase [Clostridia bacterium]|nr:HAD family hydrolase [Clostridia bacterium]
MAQSLFADYRPQESRLVCIDSDGCAFDTMEIKHKECFCPAFIQVFGLQPISKYAREVWEYGNLYSVHRGRSRFIEVILCFDWLEQREEVKRLGFQLPDISSFRHFMKTSSVVNNDTIRAEAEKGDPVMAMVLEWSLESNRRIAEMVHGIPPFPGVKDSLNKLRGQADIAIVSATNPQALRQEWTEHHMIQDVHRLCSQEDGTKKECIAGMKPWYKPENVLMIGDAPGDLEAAHENGVLYFPIRPGEEVESWQEFYAEGIDRFLKGAYQGAYEEQLIARFRKCLPDTPPWETK